MDYIKASDLRKLDKKNFYIRAIFPDYRTGYVEGLKKFRTFIWFGKAEDEVLTSGSDRIKEFTKEFEEANGRELREKEWDKLNRVFTYTKVKGKFDFKAFPKCFDMELVLEEPTEFMIWNKEAGDKVATVTDNVIVQGVSAGKVKSLIRSLVDDEIPMIDGKDKLGNEAKVEKYDFEDTMKNLLIGKFVKIKVSGQGMDTKYIFNEGKEFSIPENVEDDFPDTTPVKKKVVYKEEKELDLSDIPF